ncbi:MAG: SDR family NAD(P)-dependent oxidoreductase, partial [Gammaproteobacteria bacterium]|nr:SDR family NAD(P)-dependent oxidoreductase [Gammaproteobacteria bacterium]
MAKPVALVTGAAQGIGLATARRLAADGFQVIAVDRSAGTLEAAIGALRGDGFDVSASPADVCDRASVAGLLDRLARIDALVTAVGIYEDAAFDTLTESAFRRMLDVNVIGTFIPAQEAARRMSSGGRIVTIAS